MPAATACSPVPSREMWAGSKGLQPGLLCWARALCSPYQLLPSPMQLQKNVPLCHNFFPFPSWNVLSMGQAVTFSLPRARLAGVGRPSNHHSWKSDLYLKNKKSNKPQLFCNKPLVLTCPNTCAVSLLTSVGGLWAGGHRAAPRGWQPPPPLLLSQPGRHLPAGNVTPERDHRPLFRLRVFQPLLPPALSAGNPERCHSQDGAGPERPWPGAPRSWSRSRGR